MNRLSVFIAASITGLAVFGAGGILDAKDLPVINGKEAVATVNDEPITLDEFNMALAASHAARIEGGESKAGSIDYSAIMQRLINTRLILLEARNIGIHELPEIKSAVEAYERQILMEMLMDQKVRDVKADNGAVERLYKEAVREWKIRAVKFKAEKAAKKFKGALDAGQDFDELVQSAVASGTGEADEKGSYLKNEELTASVAQVIAQMEVGKVSPILTLGKKEFIIFKVEDMRYPEKEDPRARETARRQALEQARIAVASEFYENLRKENVEIDDALLKALDFESTSPGFDTLLEDKRIIVKVKDGQDITVGELAEAMKKKFFHGVQAAITSKMINKKKDQVLEDLMQRRILLNEARKQGIDSSDAYRRRVQEQKESLVFGAFVRKVIFSSIKLKMDELKSYYAQNTQTYATPTMVRVEAIVYGQRGSAENAVKKISSGTDFKWLQTNSGGQLPKNTPGLLRFEGQVYSMKGLPEGVRRALTEAKTGEARLYDDGNGHFYLLYVAELVPPRIQDFEEVQSAVKEKVFSNKSAEAVNEYAERLKDYYPVKIYRKDLQ